MTTIPAPSVHPTASRGPRVGSLLSPPSRVPLTRLVGLEVRKMVDTLAGRWLVIVTVALALALMIGFAVFGDAGQVTVGTSLGAAAGPFGILLPVLGIMAATAEWSQRAGLVTFSLEPRRGRIVLARVVAGPVGNVQHQRPRAFGLRPDGRQPADPPAQSPQYRCSRHGSP